jgi:hypothetical protein
MPTRDDIRIVRISVVSLILRGDACLIHAALIKPVEPLRSKRSHEINQPINQSIINGRMNQVHVWRQAGRREILHTCTNTTPISEILKGDSM